MQKLDEKGLLELNHDQLRKVIKDEDLDLRVSDSKDTVEEVVERILARRTEIRRATEEGTGSTQQENSSQNEQESGAGAETTPESEEVKKQEGAPETSEERTEEPVSKTPAKGVKAPVKHRNKIVQKMLTADLSKMRSFEFANSFKISVDILIKQRDYKTITEISKRAEEARG